jgi:hypothetical protein
MNKNCNAFPIAIDENTDNGMTLRDYFAAKAMSALISIPWYANEEKTYDEISPHLARDAYTIADAMLNERENYDY